MRSRRSLRRSATIQIFLAFALTVGGALMLAGVIAHRRQAGVALILLACFDAGMAAVNWVRSRRTGD
jgi:hypothetical protein